MEGTNKIYMILTNGFDPDVRVYKEAKYLVEQGFDLSILAWDRKCEYRDKEEENIDGIKIKRFFIPSMPGTGFKQILPYFNFIKETKKYLKTKKYKYLHCHDLDGMLVGFLLHKRTDKIIFDMHELYNSGSYSKIYFIIKRSIRFLQNKSYKIIHVNDKQIEDISMKNKGKLIFLPNYPEESKFKMIEHIPSENIRITYAGYVRHLLPLTNLVKAASELEHVKVSIHGTGEIWNQIKELEKECKNLVVTGAFKHEEIANFYSESDLIYIVYNKGNINDETALPTKFFEAILSGLPVIVSQNSLLEETVNKYDIGFSVDGTDKNSIKRVIAEIRNSPKILEYKKENIDKIKTKFIWEDVVKNLDKIYK